MCYGGCDCQRCNPPDEPRKPAAMTDTLRAECEAADIVRHYECEDSWYSCPKSPDGCSDDRQDICNCGYESRLAKLMAFARSQQARKMMKAERARVRRIVKKMKTDTSYLGTLSPRAQQAYEQACDDLLTALKGQP